MPSGVYDHKGKANTKAITALNTEYSRELAGYKEFAQALKNRSYGLNDMTRAIYDMINYLECCSAKNEPATTAGVILASGLKKDTFYRAKNGHYDHLTAE